MLKHRIGVIHLMYHRDLFIIKVVCSYRITAEVL